MTRSKSLRLAVATFSACVLAVALAAPAQDDPKPKEAPKTDQPKEADAQADAQPAAGQDKKAEAEALKQMEAWMALAKPGEHHDHLKAMEGEFDVESEMVSGPGAQPVKSKGTHKAQMMLGGRYLHGVFEGEMMGMPMTGHGLLGYDNQKQQYFSLWIDSMSTGIMISYGKCDKAGKVFTFKGDYEDPMTKSKKTYRMVTTVTDNNKHTFEWFEPGPNGKEYRMMKMTYTRAN
ncbi:MAG TPA: DUF1579 domain-containing protein [Tepidisphaeraceae bacterium]|nr:DUF1579 domain-containing protein [Tepidisphaeraceae bacterium]